jgi:acetyl esterase/lipase
MKGAIPSKQKPKRSSRVQRPGPARPAKPTCLILLIVLNLGWLAGGHAQDVIRLWDGASKPYYKENNLVEREQSVWGTRCASNVIEPTLTVFAAKGKNSGIGVVIIPGGNYSVVAIHHEGYAVAKALSDQGIVAAVLKYRLPDPKSSDQPGMVPLSDARRALKIIRGKSAKYGIDRRKVGVLGFSAGSHLATVTSLWKSEDANENPAFSGLIYGVTNDSAENMKWLEENLYFRKLTAEERARNRLLNLVNNTTPPAFLVHAYDDDTCRVEESTLYAQKLFENKVPVEMHLFPKGGHGFGAGRKTDGTDQWLPLFAAWLLRQ